MSSGWAMANEAMLAIAVGTAAVIVAGLVLLGAVLIGIEWVCDALTTIFRGGGGH